MLTKDSDELFFKKMTSLYKAAMDFVSDTDTIHCKVNKKVYFAGPWFTDRDNQVYDFCVKTAKLFKQKGPEIFFPRENSQSAGYNPKETFNNNIENIDNSDIVVAFVSTKDVGTAFELGHAYKAGIPIYLLVYDIDDVAESKTNLMLAISAKGIFTLSNWIDFLLDNMNNMEFIEIKNKWEGIE